MHCKFSENISNRQILFSKIGDKRSKTMHKRSEMGDMRLKIVLACPRWSVGITTKL